MKEWDLNQRQLEFLQSDKKYVAYIGGRGAGKSLALVLKIIQLELKYPGNYGLLGRYNYSDLRDTTEKDFFDICPQKYIRSHNKQEKQVTFINGSQLIFRGLKDVKKTEVRSLNLGFFALEQAEEIEEGLFNELAACLRRRIKDVDGKEGNQQGFFLANPAMGWLYRKCKQERSPEWDLIPGSMLENATNLSEGFLKSMMAMPESWKRIFVYGEFDEAVLPGKQVFPIEYIRQLRTHVREPINKLVDIDIYKEPEAGHEYQMGIDPSEGAEDFSAIKVIDKNTGEEVASYVSRIQPDLLAFKVVKVGHYFSTAKAVLEINGIGLATLTKLKDLNYENVFVREEYDKIAKKMTKRLGWRTTHASKPLLIGHYQELLGAKYPKIRDEKTIEEMKTYIYSDEVRKRGMGAEKSYHDDRLTAIMLAYWEVKAVYNPEDKELIIRPQESQGVKEGTFDDLKLENVIDQQTGKHWLSH